MNNIYMDFMTESARGTIVAGTLLTTIALSYNSAALSLTGALAAACGYGAILFIDNMSIVMKTSYLDAQE